MNEEPRWPSARLIDAAVACAEASAETAMLMAEVCRLAAGDRKFSRFREGPATTVTVCATTSQSTA
jgi:hypothetical protein